MDGWMGICYQIQGRSAQPHITTHIHQQFFQCKTVGWCLSQSRFSIPTQWATLLRSLLSLRLLFALLFQRHGTISDTDDHTLQNLLISQKTLLRIILSLDLTWKSEEEKQRWQGPFETEHMDGTCVRSIHLPHEKSCVFSHGNTFWSSWFSLVWGGHACNLLIQWLKHIVRTSSLHDGWLHLIC